MKLAAMFLAFCVAVAVSNCFGTVTSSGFVPNHTYTVSDGGGVLEWNEQLQIVGSPFGVSGIGAATGAIFDDAGNFVFLGGRADGAHVIAVNSSGQVTHEYDPGTNFVNRGSYIAFDPGRGLFAFANGDRLTILDANLDFVAQTAAVFTRASGVTFAPDGEIFATDQFQQFVSVFSPSFDLERQIPFSGNVPVGLDYTSNGNLLIGAYGSGSVYSMDPTSGATQTLVSGLGFSTVSDVEELPNGEFETIGDHTDLRLFSSSGQPLLATPSNAFGDGMAVYVPEPASGSFIFAALIVFGSRRAGKSIAPALN